MKIFYIAVFDEKNMSTNNSQARGFEAAGHDVYRYSFRDRGQALGDANRDLELQDVVISENPDLVVFSKCEEISEETVKFICDRFKTCYWYMDPLTSVKEDYLKKASYCTFAAVAIRNVVPSFKKLNEKSFLVYEGFDHTVDAPVEVDKKFDVSFIGSLHSNRSQLLMNLEPNVTHITGAYGKNHALAVCSSRINVNISTSGGASDRVFKVLAAGGFLLTTDWEGREEMFEDEKHLVIFSGKEDLQKKIKYYLDNETEAANIANNGLLEVKKYNRDEWAVKIVELFNEVLNG